DQAGDLEKLVRLDPNRLGPDWKVPGGQAQYHAAGMQGGRCLQVGEAPASQETMGFLGQHSTWGLDFHYRSLDPKTTPELLAGLMAQGDFPDSVARHFRAGPEWSFARVVIKSGSNCKKLLTGFSARGGTVLVDGAQLRRVRFPSINHLL